MKRQEKADAVEGHPLPCGRFIPEEAPEALLVDLQACDWQENDFFALALQASECFQRDKQTLSLFTYDLLDYKQVPDWLNAKFWANPENFGKYWW